MKYISGTRFKYRPQRRNQRPGCKLPTLHALAGPLWGCKEFPIYTMAYLRGMRQCVKTIVLKSGPGSKLRKHGMING